MFSTWPRRTACDVLEEMRKLYESLNFGGMKGLIEEMQGIANRMEAGLGDKKDSDEYLEKKRVLKREIRKLEKEKKLLEEEIEDTKQDKK